MMVPQEAQARERQEAITLFWLCFTVLCGWSESNYWYKSKGMHNGKSPPAGVKRCSNLFQRSEKHHQYISLSRTKGMMFCCRGGIWTCSPSIPEIYFLILGLKFKFGPCFWRMSLILIWAEPMPKIWMAQAISSWTSDPCTAFQAHLTWMWKCAFSSNSLHCLLIYIGSLSFAPQSNTPLSLSSLFLTILFHICSSAVQP